MRSNGILRTLLAKINGSKMGSSILPLLTKGRNMVYKVKGKFGLDIYDLQRIVNDILKQPKNKDVKITVKKSDNENSKSLYLFIDIEGVTTCLRISDHKCRGEVRQMLVCGSTGKANVYYKIEKVIQELRYKRLLRALGR